MSKTLPLSKKLHVKTYGCQMNVYDSRPHGGRTLAPHWAMPMPSAPEADADLVILNTCHIREKASEKVYLRARPPAPPEGGEGRAGAAGG